MGGNAKRNAQLELDKLIEEITQAGKRPRLLLHACCAPCASYCMEYLSRYFDLSVYYDNPNIDTKEEYSHRLKELKRLVSEMTLFSPVKVLEAEFEPRCFYEIAKGHEKDPERGERCHLCYRLRLFRTAEFAKKYRKAGEPFDYFCTSLSISPLKDAGLLLSIGESLGEQYGIPYLPSDFKKKGGYQRSIELSKAHGLYRQDYCGCVYSKEEAKRRRAEGQSG